MYYVVHRGVGLVLIFDNASTTSKQSMMFNVIHTRFHIIFSTLCTHPSVTQASFVSAHSLAYAFRSHYPAPFYKYPQTYQFTYCEQRLEQRQQRLRYEKHFSRTSS